eukprot:CAMPEP_0170321256 /NCGR_PEP_ID=MMETSP0116_2-20130129/61385_1 /TAXON_ID=400756 /ORGANISM="Durinskia baltica, Strain CSIRO CS-38" /LENGTH=43 /DNA_ID= /DNA_START= /DNA_END= /DNA_ORIENTATION=
MAMRSEDTWKAEVALHRVAPWATQQTLDPKCYESLVPSKQLYV